MKEIKIFHDSGAIDISLISSFENKMNCIFPGNYKKLLSEHNELYPDESNFKFVNAIDGEVDSRDVTFLGYGPGVTNASNIEWFQDHDVYGRVGVVVIGIAANGDYICFDYRSAPKTDNPPVVVMLHDYYDDDGKMFICSVADSFEEFMDSLYKPEDE
ncbi:SMI1/KNR4 family protein [Sedimenticola sp.]|uniref:SMI1/KNR4 family protein n=1 Tax=Sedimenticola sp. TaxID=1940285 RepID=UPI003D12BEE8